MNEFFIACFNLVTLYIIPPSLFQLGGCELWDQSPILTQLIKSVVLVPLWKKNIVLHEAYECFSRIIPKIIWKIKQVSSLDECYQIQFFPIMAYWRTRLYLIFLKIESPSYRDNQTHGTRWKLSLERGVASNSRPKLVLKFRVFFFERGIKLIHQPTPSH